MKGAGDEIRRAAGLQSVSSGTWTWAPDEMRRGAGFRGTKVQDGLIAGLHDAKTQKDTKKQRCEGSAFEVRESIVVERNGGGPEQSEVGGAR